MNFPFFYNGVMWNILKNPSMKCKLWEVIIIHFQNDELKEKFHYVIAMLTKSIEEINLTSKLYSNWSWFFEISEFFSSMKYFIDYWRTKTVLKTLVKYPFSICLPSGRVVEEALTCGTNLHSILSTINMYPI